jgi:hypothetical protein
LIAGYALSLEVSTLSALASGHFASAHEKLGRNHPTLGFKEEDLSEEFFSSILGFSVKLLCVEPFKVMRYNIEIIITIVLNTNSSLIPCYICTYMLNPAQWH